MKSMLRQENAKRPSLEERLEAILTPEQKEIAHLCGLSSADYAIELVRLSQLKIMEKQWRD